MVLEGNLSRIKKQYGKNTVVLDYDGDASFIQNFPEVEKIDDYGKFMEIKLKEKSDPQALLQSLVGKIAINKYEIQEPSLIGEESTAGAIWSATILDVLRSPTAA